MPYGAQNTPTRPYSGPDGVSSGVTRGLRALTDVRGHALRIHEAKAVGDALIEWWKENWMDPDAALKELRALIKEELGEGGSEAAADSWERIAELFNALDEWLAIKGGYLPKEWDNGKRS